MYIALPALATMSRAQLKSAVLENSQVRYSMDHGAATYTRDLVEAFVGAKYSRVLQLLDEYKVGPSLRSREPRLTHRSGGRCTTYTSNPKSPHSSTPSATAPTCSTLNRSKTSNSPAWPQHSASPQQTPARLSATSSN